MTREWGNGSAEAVRARVLRARLRYPGATSISFDYRGPVPVATPHYEKRKRTREPSDAVAAQHDLYERRLRALARTL